MRENQPKHRQERRLERKLVRKTASRAGLPSVLIVCEGRETEPNYIRGLCAKLKINMAAVSIRRGSSKTDAAALVRLARNMFEADRDYDRVFVVCDDDGSDLGHARVLAAKKLRPIDKQLLTIDLIVSTPSFEYWLLLHFEYSARPFASAAEVTRELRRHVTDYDKADLAIFGKVASGVEIAVERVGQLKRDLEISGSARPNTDMHTLVEQLSSMTTKNS